MSSRLTPVCAIVIPAGSETLKQMPHDAQERAFGNECLANCKRVAAFERTYGSAGGSKPRRVNPMDGFGMK